MKTPTKYTSVLAALMLCAGGYAQTLADAIRLTDNEQYANAKAVFKSLVAKEPTNGDNFYYFGQLMIKEEDPDSARILFQKGIDINATNPLVHIGMADSYFLSGKSDEAMKEITTAKSLISVEAGKKGSAMTPQRQAVMDVEIAKAMLMSSAPDYQAAFDLCNIAYKLDPKNIEAILVRGDVLNKKDPVNATPAIASYNDAAKADPKSNKAYLRIGNIMYNGKNYMAAVSNYNKALMIDSTFAPAYRARGEAQFAGTHFDSASVSFEKYLKLNPDPEARYRYMAALYKSKDYDNCVKQGEILLKKDSSIAVVYRIMGRCYAEMAKPDAAKGVEYLNKFFAKQAIGGKPKLIPDDYVYRGKCYAKLGSDSLAILDYQSGLKLDSNRRDLFTDIAATYFKMKKYDQAAIYYKKKIDANPTKAAAADWNAYGRSLFLQKDYVAADSAFRRITQFDPKNPIGWLWRGRCNASLDPDIKSDSARKFYEMYWDLAIADKDKNKKDLVIAAKYLGGYHYVKKNFACTKAYFQFIVDLDPTQTDVKTQLDTDKDIKAATAADLTTCRMPK